jgi:transposase InsO family protein
MTDKEIEIMKQAYELPGHTNSVAGLWAQVRKHGILKKTVATFLKQQPDYQTLQAKKKAKRTNTMVRYKPGYVQIDLIDIEQLGSPKAMYLLTCVDIFTRKLWAYPLENKTPEAVAEKLAKLVKEYKYLNTIQSDNGNEFKGRVAGMLNRNNIRHILSTPGNPTTNAYVERANGTIKRALYGYLQKTGNDPIPDLQDFVDSINLVPNETTKVVPEVAVLPKNEDKISTNILKYASKKNTGSSAHKEFNVGDKVRLLLEKDKSQTATFKNKLKNAKGYLPRWSFEIYTIVKKTTPKSEYSVPQYYLDKSTNINDKTQTVTARYNPEDLLLIDDTQTKGETHVPQKQLLQDMDYQVVKKKGRPAIPKPAGPKRAVGRPRKEKAPDAVDTAPAVKRPRGRPKKPRNPVGRPKKIIPPVAV